MAIQRLYGSTMDLSAHLEHAPAPTELHQLCPSLPVSRRRFLETQHTLLCSVYAFRSRSRLAACSTVFATTSWEFKVQELFFTVLLVSSDINKNLAR